MKNFVRFVYAICFLLIMVLWGSVASGTVLDEALVAKYSNNRLIISDARHGMLETASVFPVTQGFDKVGEGRINFLSCYDSEHPGRVYITFYQGKAKVACFLIKASEAKKIFALLTGDASFRNGAKIRTTNCNLT
jgi:hypothetical protein